MRRLRAARRGHEHVHYSEAAPPQAAQVARGARGRLYEGLWGGIPNED